MGTLNKSGYLEHLIDIKEKLNDFKEFFDKGRIGYSRDIALKLRVLYIKKSGTEPLISSVEKHFNFKFLVKNALSLHESVEKGLVPADLITEQMIYFHNAPLYWLDKREKYNKLPIIQAFEKERAIVLSGAEFSVKKVIEVVADQMGGAHIDKKVRDKDLLLHENNFLLGGLTLSNRVIYDVCRETIRVIEIIENYITKGISSEFIEEVPGSLGDSIQ